MSTSPEEYHADEETESPDTGTAYNPTTGEAETTPHDQELVDTDPEAGNPNAGTSAGLAGDMGISSERTGPADETGTEGLGGLDDFRNTGTVGSARSRSHGTVPTGPRAETGEQPAADDDAESQDIAGESNTAEVPSHPLSNKNPGHSGGTPGQGQG